MNRTIYKITSPSHVGKAYIGMTSQPINKRFAQHRQLAKRVDVENCRSRELFHPNDDCVIETLEFIPHSNYLYALERETYYIRNTPGAINKATTHPNTPERMSRRLRDQIYDNRRVDCGCGSTVRRGGLHPHRHTIKHKRYIMSLDPVIESL